jgi:hypothetical protein
VDRALGERGVIAARYQHHGQIGHAREHRVERLDRSRLGPGQREHETVEGVLLHGAAHAGRAVARDHVGVESGKQTGRVLRILTYDEES